MVLTTVPQTALPVQAEEATEASLDTASEGTEEVTPGSDEKKESEETTETKEPADGEGESNEGSSEVTTPADGENENGEDEVGDNSDDSVTPDIENPGEDQDTENPDEEVTEPVVDPVEEPAEEEPVEEGTSTVDSEDATVMAATTFGIEFKISVDGTELEEPTLNEYVTEITNVDTDNKVDDTNDVTFKVTPTDAQLELDGAPTATIAGTNATVSEASGVYTITDSHSATGDVVVTINLVTKYTVGAPAADTDAKVTWQIRTTASDAAYGSSVSVKKGESVVLQATLEANADNVTITVPGATTEKQTLTATTATVTAEFTVAMTKERIEALAEGKLTATYEVTKADAEVVITGKKPGAAEGVDDVTAVFGTDFTAQYRVKTTGAEDFDAWKAVSGGKIAAKKDDVVQLKVAPGAKFSVSGVKFAGNTVNATEIDDEDVYQFTVNAPANPVATENTVEVTLAAANQITLQGATDAQIASVKWSTDGSTYKYARKTASGWVADTKAESVTFQVTAKEHNKVSYINNDTKGAHVTAETGCTNCLTLTSTDNNKTVTTDAVVANGADDITLTIATEQIKHDYTLMAAEGLTVTITKAGASTPESPKGTTDADKNKYALLEGETYFVAVKQGEDVVALEKLETATANNTTMDYDSDADAFTFEVDAVTAEANRTIVIELKERENKTVSLVMADAQLSAASVKADAHKKLNDTTKAEEDVAADPTAIVLSTTEKEYTVAEGGKFTFTLSAVDEAYTVSKVETSTDSGATWSGLEKGTDDKYTLAEVNEDISIRVTTELDQTKAHSVIFTPDENVKEIKIKHDGTDEVVKSGEKTYVKVATGANVAFTVTQNAGFTVDKVKFGTGETDDVPVSAGTYTYTFPAARTDATITISTKAAELTADRYVKFAMPDDENVKLNVTTAGVKTEKDSDGDDVYVMTMKKTEPATEEVPELAFDLVVKNGYTIKPQLASIVDAANETVRMTADSRKKNDDGDWVYSFKVVAAALQAASLGTKEAPKTITVTAPIEEKVTLSLKADSSSVKYKNLSQSGSNFTTWTAENSKTASDKDTIVLQVADGQSLSISGKDVTEELDDYGNYSFVAALDATKDNDTNIEIDVKNSAAAEYELKYGDVEGTYPDTVGKDVVTAKLGDKIYVQLNKTTAPAGAEAITGVVLSEGAKSTAVANKNQDEAANKGKAVITVADADFTVTFKAIKTETTANGFTKKTVVNAATVHINAKDADGMNLTAKGISEGKTIKIDATKQMTYPLTLKETKTSRNVLDVKKYIADGAIVAEEIGSKGLVTVSLDEETGSLVITGVKDKDGEAKAVSEITIKAKGAAADAKPLLTFKVEVTTPKLTVKSLNSPNQGMHDVLVDVTGDPKIGTVAAEFDMYYEIEVKHTAGESAAKKDGFYYLNALDGNGNVVPVSQLIKVNADTDKTKFENTYTINARLVAVAAGAEVPQGNPLQGEAKAKIADSVVKYSSAKTVEKKNIKTRSDYYEDKLNVTKKTTKLYTGQSNVLVAIPKFSAKAGHIEDIHAEVYNTDGSLATSGVTATVDETNNTMEVRVSAGRNAAPGKGTAKYNVVIYATATMNAGDAAVDPGAYNMYRASAKVPITVQKGIHSITVAGNPGKIAIVPDKNGKTKNVSFSLKPTGWYSNTSYKAQTQKFDYSNEITYGNNKNAGKVTVKNGKVTVDKDFYVSNDPAQNTFTLTVKANDWTGNETVSSPVTVEVTNKAMTISSVRLVDSNNKPYGATITTTDLCSADLEILDENGKSIEPSFVTLTPNKGKLYVDESGELNFEGYQKNLTITAVAKDGKKAKKSSIKYTINYAKADAYTLDVNSVNNSFKQLSDTSWEYVGRGNETISFDVKAIANDRGYTAENPDSAWTKEYNYSVKITGGKNTSSKTDVASGEYEVTPTAGKVTVTVTDKAARKSYPFTIEDKGWATAAAPKATTKDKLFMAKNPSIDDPYNTYVNRVAQNMTYTIKNCKYNAAKFTHVGGSYYGIDNLEGVHVIDGDTLRLEGLVPNYPTTEKYSVVYGDKDENGFWPKTKATTISIKVNKVGNIKAVNKYTISTNLGYGVKLDAKPIPTSVTLNDVVEFNSIEAANEKGQPNKFYDYFELVNGAGDADGPKDTIQLKTAYRTEAGLAELYALKRGVAGYVTYTVYNPNGYEVKKQDKITVVVNDTGKPKTTATDINIVGLSGASGFTTVKIGNTSVDVLKVVTDSTDWKVAVPTAAEIEAGAEGNVKLTANGEPKSGNVNVYILPVGSKYAASTPDADVITNGIKATVKVNVKAADDTKSSKITFLSKNAKTPEAVIAGTKVNLSTTFTLGRDYKYTLTNAKIASVAKVPEAREAEIKGAPSKTASKAILATNGVTLNADKTAVTIVMDRDAAGLATNGKTTYKVPVLVTFDAGAEEIVYFSIKPAKVPSVDEVKADVEAALKGFAVAEAAYNNGASAASAVQEAARKLGNKVPALSGVDVVKITAAAKPDTETEKFADTGTVGSEGFKAGHHTVIVTLDDETKKGTEGYTAATCEVVVTKAAASVSLGASLEEAINVYLLPNQTTGADPTGKKPVPTTMTKWTLQTELQAAADKAEPGKYIVRVTEFDLDTAEVTPPAASGTNAVNADEGTKKTIVSGLTFKYTVMVAKTGKYLAADGSESTVNVEFTVTMGTTTNQVGKPGEPTPPVVDPDPEEPEAFDVTISGVSASTVTYAVAEANDETVPNSFNAVAGNKVSVESGKKLYLKVEYSGGTVTVKKGDNETLSEVSGNAGVYLVGTITETTAVTITETASTTPTEPES